MSQQPSIIDRLHQSWRTVAILSATLFAAFAIEVVNLGLSPLDPGGYPSDRPWGISLIHFQWIMLHLPAMFAAHWVNRGLGIRGHDVLIVFVGGYLTTALLSLATVFVVWKVYRARRLRDTQSTRPTPYLPSSWTER